AREYDAGEVFNVGNGVLLANEEAEYVLAVFDGGAPHSIWRVACMTHAASTSSVVSRSRKSTHACLYAIGAVSGPCLSSSPRFFSLCQLTHKRVVDSENKRTLHRVAEFWAT